MPSTDAPSITCPVCGATSHNPNDVREGYCGRCHDWTGPRFTHDCKRCTFLGRHLEDDLYFCEQDVGGPTVIARHGNAPRDYTSGLGLAGLDLVLAVAREMAKGKGLIESRLRLPTGGRRRRARRRD